MPPYKPRTYARTANSGAQKGLEMKMDYWKQRDFKTEFNIAVSQAVNLVKTEDFVYPDPAGTVPERVMFWFDTILRLRADRAFREKFEKFYAYVQKLETETAESQPGKLIADKHNDTKLNDAASEAAVE